MPVKILSTVLLLLSMHVVAQAQEKNFRDLLLFVPDAELVTASEQKSLLAQDSAGCAQRDIRVLVYRGGKDDASFHRYGIPVNRFAVVLVGKDGIIKRRWIKPVTTKELFAVIDAMPMRKEEMKSDK